MAALTRNQIYKPTMNAGQVYMRVSGADSAMYPIGNVSSLEISISEDEKSLQDYTTPGGGQWAAVSRITEVTAAMVLHDLDINNLARAVYGAAADVAAGSVASESVHCYIGGLTRLAHPDPTSVAITGKTAGTDFVVRPEGLFIPVGSTIADDSDVTVAYSYGAYGTVQALTSGSETYELSFGGINEADSNNPVVLDIFKIKISAASALGFISNDFAQLEVKGKITPDSTKTGTGISRYFKVSMV